MKNIIYIVLAFLLLITPVSTVQAASANETQSGMVSEEPVQATSLSLSINEVLSDPTVESLQSVQIDQPKVTMENKPETLQEMAKRLVTERFGADQYTAFASIVTKESNWDLNARNSYSGACGMPQALPCSKLKDHSAQGQLTWMINYIAQRYRTPKNAWYFEQMNNYY